MPRKMRVQFSGAMYHVMSRGDQRDDIFFEGLLQNKWVEFEERARVEPVLTGFLGVL